jgi:hypothetical protein
LRLYAGHIKFIFVTVETGHALSLPLVGIYDYWEEGEYQPSKPDTAKFEQIAQNVASNFFSMDIARQKNGELIIIELGDGQVAGLPDSTDRNEFYQQLKNCWL